MLSLLQGRGLPLVADSCLVSVVQGTEPTIHVLYRQTSTASALQHSEFSLATVKFTAYMPAVLLKVGQKA